MPDEKQIAEQIAKIQATGLHCNPVSEKEDKQRDVFIADFSASLFNFLKDASEKAEEIGGYYRSPGIKRQLNQILRGFDVK